MKIGIPTLLGQRLDFSKDRNWTFIKGLGRSMAGAIIFSLPILMTMEMWWLGFYLDALRIVQFAFVNFLVLIGLSRVSGFEQTHSIADDVLDSLTAYGLAALWSAAILFILGIIEAGMSASEIIGKVAIQAIPASFGAMIAGKQLGAGNGSKQDQPGDEQTRRTYWGQLFLMLAGALFLGFSVAPTEEMILISFRMIPWHVIALVLLSIFLLHTIVYTVGLKGEEKPPGPTSFWSILLRFSIVGYAISALASLYVLWTFGRVENTGVEQVIEMVAVLSFPGAVGAALARLVI